MDFDPRWPDDPRDRDDYGRELSQGSRGGLSNPREREPLDARDVFTRDLELPRGPEPVAIWISDRGRSLKRLCSMFTTACTLLGHMPGNSTGGMALRRARSVDGFVSSAAV
jgi:hypothetical protein